jgi:hypothetical protein
MLFKRKFFLDLSGDREEAPPAVVAPVRQPAAEPAPPASPAPAALTIPASTAPSAESAGTATAAAEAPAAEAPTAGSSLTTAEAIAAELAAAEAARPAPSLTTFAPEFLNPGGAVPTRRRRAGANLAGFKEMAQGMMKS